MIIEQAMPRTPERLSSASSLAMRHHPSLPGCPLCGRYPGESRGTADIPKSKRMARSRQNQRRDSSVTGGHWGDINSRQTTIRDLRAIRLCPPIYKVRVYRLAYGGYHGSRHRRHAVEITENSMFKLLTHCALLSLVLMPHMAIADPITLKLAFFTSDQSKIFNIAIKPFIDAMNEEGSTKIETYASGSLGKDQAQQPQMVRDGVADIAFVVLGPTGNQFPDRSVMELPGLFNDMREATLVCTRLIASGI